jgi:hypothetical protein
MNGKEAELLRGVDGNPIQPAPWGVMPRKAAPVHDLNNTDITGDVINAE